MASVEERPSRGDRPANGERGGQISPAKIMIPPKSSTPPPPPPPPASNQQE